MAAQVLPLFPAGEERPEEEGSALPLEELFGRLVELSGRGPSAVLSAAMGLVIAAQRRGEPVAWVTPEGSCFFPPDAARGGVRLDALVVVRVPPPDVPRAVEVLARSGGFALLVADLADAGRAFVPMPLLSRLSGLARRHHAAIAFLTRKGAEQESAGSLVSLRAEAVRERDPRARWDRRYRVRLRVLKDKQKAPGRRFWEAFRGPPGLC